MTDATTNLVIGSGVVLGIGSIVDEKMPNMKLILAGSVVVIGLSVLDNVEPQLSTGFAAIIFIALCAKYLPNAIDKLGFSGGGSGNNIQPPADSSVKPSSATNVPSAGQNASAFTPTFSGVIPNSTGTSSNVPSAGPGVTSI